MEWNLCTHMEWIWILSGFFAFFLSAAL